VTHGGFINSCTDVQEGEIMTKISNFQTQMPNQTHQFHLLNHLVFFSIMLQFLYIIFCFESISIVKKTLQQLKSFLETHLHTHLQYGSHSRELPRPPLQTSLNDAKIFFVWFRFGKVMMAIDGIPSQTIATHIIQNPIPCKTKRGSKDGSEQHDVRGS